MPPIEQRAKPQIDCKSVSAHMGHIAGNGHVVGGQTKKKKVSSDCFFMLY